MSKKPLTLVMDSALGHYSVAVWSGDHCLASRLNAEKNRAASGLLVDVESALGESGTAYTDLDQIACTVGPGSFTGIRIALSAARAMGLASKKPVVGISTLAALAFSNQPKTSAIRAFLPAGRGQVYTQAFDANLHPLSEPDLANIDAFEGGKPANEIWIGESSRPLPELLGALDASIALDAATFGAVFTDANCAHLLLPAHPLYVRPPDAKLPKAAI